MTLRTSLVIGGDAQGAIAAVNATESGLNGITTAAGRAAAANDQLGASAERSTRQARAGYVNFGRQVQDISVQLQSGTNIGTIIAQQGGQVADAVSQMGGRFAGLATFLSGPWGAAVLIGTSLLVDLGIELWNAGDKSDDLSKKSMSLHDALRLAAMGSEEARKALADYNAEQDRARNSTEDMIKINLGLAKSQLVAALAIRETLKARQAEAAFNAKANAGQGTGGAAGAFTGGEQAKAQAALDENQGVIDRLNETIGNLTIQDATRDAKAAVDPIQAVNNKYDDMAAAAKRAAAGNKELQQSLKGTLALIEAQRQAELRDLRSTDKKPPRPRADPYSGRDTAEFGSPIPGAPITSKYGQRRRPTKGASSNHLAIDYGAKEGTPVYATQDGIVSFSEDRGAYGNQIGVNHGGGTESRYAHLSRFNVQKGQEVSKGDVIGYVGSTGVATGPHLHYEVLVNGKKVDPSKGRFPIDASAVAEEADKAGEALQKFGDQAEQKIAGINAQFDEQPRLIDRANAATAELDRTIAELSERKPIGWEGLVAEAEAAKGTIQDALVRPFEELQQASQRRLQIETLITAGQEDQAEALERIWQLEEVIGPLTAARKQEILDQVMLEREQTKELRYRQQQLDGYLSTTRSIKQEVTSIFAGEGSAANIGKIARGFSAQMLVEKIFGPGFEDMEDWIKDQSGLRPSVDYFTQETVRAGEATGNLANAAVQAADRLSGIGQTASQQGLSADFDQTFGRSPASGQGLAGLVSLASAVGAAIAAQAPSVPQELTVTGKPGSTFSLTPNEYFGKMGDSMAGSITGALNKEFGTQFFSKFEGVLSGGIKGYLTAGPVGGVLGALQAIPGLPKGISAELGKALGGAQTGAYVSGIAGAFGIKLNSTGSSIGGSLGALTGIPGGSIIGSIAGGIFGNLFGKRPRGGGSVSNTAISASANDDAITGSLNETGGNLQAAIKQIAGSLGASVGDYSIGIGRYKDYYQVSSNPNDKSLGGSNFAKNSASDLYDGLDAGAAMKAALAGAIAQGAIQGISAQMQQALKSSSDVQAAIEEALKVHQVELAIGGIGAQLEDQFKAFERQAAERLRIAKQYGFDVAKIEEKNAADRAKLVKDMLADQVGSLQQFIDDMTSGSLFEGSAVDQRTVLLDKISAAKAAVAAGEEGAGDRLAQLLAQANAVSKDVYGTTGGFAADRTAFVDAARDAIAEANRRIADAQRASDPALSKTNAALDENNDQNAQLIAGMAETNARLAQLEALLAGGSNSALLSLARTSGAIGG